MSAPFDHSASATDPSALTIPPATTPLLLSASPPVSEKGMKGSGVTAYRSAATSKCGAVIHRARNARAGMMERRAKGESLLDRVFELPGENTALLTPRCRIARIPRTGTITMPVLVQRSKSVVVGCVRWSGLVLRWCRSIRTKTF